MENPENPLCESDRPDWMLRSERSDSGEDTPSNHNDFVFGPSAFGAPSNDPNLNNNHTAHNDDYVPGIYVSGCIILE